MAGEPVARSSHQPKIFTRSGSSRLRCVKMCCACGRRYRLLIISACSEERTSYEETEIDYAYNAIPAAIQENISDPLVTTATYKRVESETS